MTAVERAGDFSGAPVTIFDPDSSTDRNNREPFPNGQIPASRFSPASLNFLKVSPLPAADGFSRFSFAEPEDGTQYIGRVDYIINDSHNLTFRYFQG